MLFTVESWHKFLNLSIFQIKFLLYICSEHGSMFQDLMNTINSSSQADHQVRQNNFMKNHVGV